MQPTSSAPGRSRRECGAIRTMIVTIAPDSRKWPLFATDAEL
jgi:hypothetical protein